MAINPELITTIRVDQLPDEALSLTNLIPHSVGTDLKSATIQELVDLVATAIGVSGGVGYIAISVTDGQQLPDVPELPSFFLCGAGTFLNINGYPDVICTENLNAIMSLTDHWELAVEIPINPLSGTVQSVTGSAVDNTDPLNPVINEIIYGVQNIVAGTNITVDNTDPANPIVSATGGGGTPTLQEVLDNNHDLVGGNFYAGTDAGLDNIGGNVNALGSEAAKNNEGDSVNAFGASAASDNIGTNINALGINAGLLNEGSNVNALGSGAGNANTFNHVNLFGENATADEDGQTVLSKDDTIMARISTTDLTDTRKYNLPDSSGTIALTSDITTPTLQEVTDAGNETTNKIIVKDNENSFTLQSNGMLFEDLDDGGNTILRFENTSVTDQEVLIRGLGGTMALLSDIPTGSGIPHATAAGTDTYTATITGVTAYNDADAYLIRFTNGNTTGATLNINSLGAKTLYRNNDGALIGGDIISGGEMLCVYNSTNNHFQVIGTAPNSLFSYVTNADSVTLTKGMPVYAFSGTGDRMTVKRAYNTSDATSAQTVGLVLSTSIGANQKGLIMMQGLLDGLSILPTSTWSDGDPVYLGATAGTITNVKPYAPNHLVYLGVVTTASNGSAGRMYVRIQNGFELSEIHDIDLISNAPTNNEVLTYESSTDLWKNKSLGTILGYTPFRFVQTSQTAHTGTVAETIIATATINGGTFNSSDVMKVLFKTTKSNTSSVAMRLKINTTNTLVGATQIGLLNFTALANTYVLTTRTFDLQGGNLFGYNFNSSLVSDITNTNTNGSSTAYNTTNTLYLFFTLQSATILDTVTPNLCNITN
jgi:hypothetical protein